MERQQCNPLQNFDDSKSEILKKRLLKSANTAVSSSNQPQTSSQHNVLMNTLRAPTSSSMIVTSVPTPQSSMSIAHNLVTHSIAPVKIHTNTSTYPLQLSTVHVPVQIPGSTSNINVPVQLSGATNNMPLHITPVSLPLQVSGTTNVPVQLPAGETINVPLQIPTASQNIQLAGPSMPIMQNTNQSLSSIIHVHMGSNTRHTRIDGSSEMSIPNSSQLQLPDSSGVQIKMTTPQTQVQMGTNPTVVQIPNSANSSIQLALPSSGTQGPVQLRGTARPVPHVVYIQTPTGLKPVTSSDVISQASSSGNPPHIIVRRPVSSNPNIHLISNVGSKPNIAPKLPQKSSILAPSNSGQPIVIQKPKTTDKMMVPVSIAPGAQGKQTIAYLGSMKKTAQKPTTENQSILISNNQPNGNSNNQKLFLTPMMPKMQNTKFILPVTLPATMASKGPIINLQIANGQIQNDPTQGNSITVMRESSSTETSDMPPLQPLAKVVNVNGKDNSGSVPQSPKSENSFAMSIPGSRAEPTGEQGEYTLSIPETNASMNDDIYTVSIADEEGGQTREKSFTLAIPEKGKSLLYKSIVDKNDMAPITIAAPAILRRSNSDNSERKTNNPNLKRRVSLCSDNMTTKNYKFTFAQPKSSDKLSEQDETESNDDHRVPSLFCDEKLEEPKVIGDSDHDDYKDNKPDVDETTNPGKYTEKPAVITKSQETREIKRMSVDSTVEEDPPGLVWNNGIATLRGSHLQFHTNEFGLIDIIENSDSDEVMIPSAKYQTPLTQRVERTGRDKKPTSPEDMYRCDGCGCHGMAADFINPNFCSVACQQEYQKLALKKRERERSELARRRNKIKKLLMRKNSRFDLDAGMVDNGDDKPPLKQYDGAGAETHPEQKPIEDYENEKYPWMCGKNGFSWMRYLEVCKAKAAPVKLFKDPFPYNRNNFKVGMRMEAIDPQHPSLFCVVSVAEVQGYRMRLHFDAYSDVYDYWVNADCPDIFPAGWCEKNGRTLRPPPPYSTTTFAWPLYLKQMRAVAAPKLLFPHVATTQAIKPNGFRIGMKLEAEDRKNELVCVATVADMLDNRLLINFDSWDEMYDYWVEPSSPYIHPVGWAEEHGVSLTPPNFYKDPDTFSWESYLEETSSSAAPPRAFKTRPPVGFKPGMKLEVVDPKVPFLIRVASVSAVRGHQLRITFDGWGDELAQWLDDDSPDLHPVGWCLKTQHPLEPPLTLEELRVCGPCGVGGCRGLGSARGGSYKTHSAASSCPYRRDNAHIHRAPDRLASLHEHAQHVTLPLPKEQRRIPAKPKSIQASTPTPTPTSDTKEKLPRGRPPKHKRVEEVVKTEVSDDESVCSSGISKRWRGGGAAAVRTYSRAPPPPPSLPPATTDAPPHHPPPPPAPHPPCQKYIDDLDLPEDPTTWTKDDVIQLASHVCGNGAGAAIRAARLTGAALLLASRDDLVHAARLRLGPAVKLYAIVRHLRDNIVKGRGR